MSVSPNKHYSVDEHLTIPQVAERLQVSTATVWRWIASGKLGPAVYLGRKMTRLRASVVNKFLEQRSVTI